MSHCTPRSIQPLYLAQASVFTFDLEQNRSWTPLQDSLVPISILYDENRAIYRIISMDINSDSKKVLINSTILPFLEFHKTSGTFGHWTDKSTRKIFGIGFSSQYELDAFEDCLKKAQSAVYTLVKEPELKPYGDGFDSEVPQSCIYPSGITYQNWIPLLNQVKKTNAKVPTILIPEAVPSILSERLTDGDRGQGEGRNFVPSDQALLKTLRSENMRLKHVSMESASNAKKWETQIETIKSENQALISNMDRMTAELGELQRQEGDLKSAISKWKEYISLNAKKLQGMKELEQKVHFVGEENLGLEQRLQGLRQKAIKTEFKKEMTLEELGQLEGYYRNLLDNTSKTLEELCARNQEGKSVFQRIDKLCAKTIHDLIAVHEKIRDF